MTFGEWLRKELNVSGMSNAELARRAGVSATYVGNLVRDYSPNMRSARNPRPSEEVTADIAKALDVPLNVARKAAGYSTMDEPDEEGLFAGLSNLSPERQHLAKRQIRAIISSLATEDDEEDD